jgi:dihydrofolate synthase/folylpolyglutamate synthase
VTRRSEPLEFLDGLPRYATDGAAAVKPGFERVLALLDRLGNPHLAAPTVHVAGTNGKGSTASYIAAIATASGLRSGLHTSPHLVSVTERMRVDGVPAPLAWLSEAVAALRRPIRRVGASYFEVTLALSFAWFAEQRAEVVVVEVGLGGRLDATNVVDPAVCVITDIGLDHVDLLGDTVQAIAREKAGIMKYGIPVVAADSGPEVEAVLRESARAAGCPLHLVREEVVFSAGVHRLTLETPLHRYENIPIGLPGPVQTRNAALAVRAVELLRGHEGLEGVAWPDAVRVGLTDVTCMSGLRGRMETLLTSPLVVADVSHNAEGIRSALETFGAMHPAGRRIVILGIMADKPVRTMVRSVVESGALVVPVAVPSDRAVPAEELAAVVRDLGGTCEAVIEEGPGSVPDWIRTHAVAGDGILIAGSHYLVGPVLAAWS